MREESEWKMKGRGGGVAEGNLTAEAQERSSDQSIGWWKEVERKKKRSGINNRVDWVWLLLLFLLVVWMCVSFGWLEMLYGSVNLVQGHCYERRKRRRKVKKVLGGERFFLYGEGEGEVDRGLGFCQSRTVIKGRSEWGTVAIWFGLIGYHWTQWLYNQGKKRSARQKAKAEDQKLQGQNKRHKRKGRKG